MYLPQNPRISFSARFFRLIPGVALLAVIGFAGKLLEKNVNAYAKANHLVIPNIEYVLWAILIGLVISNVFGLAEIFKPGVATYEVWLKAGIVLLGSRFLLGDVWKLGGVSLVLVFIEIIGSLAFMTFLGQLFGLRPKLTSLLAVGSAVCGVSAIIATKGALDADDEDSSFSLPAILPLRALALFPFPPLGPRAPSPRSRLRHLGRPRRRQHRRSHRCRCALFRRRREARCLDQDLPQRPHRLHRSRLRHLLRPPPPGAKRYPQSRLPLAEIPHIRSRFSACLRAGALRLFP